MSSSKSKRMKSDIASKSLLPKNVIAILNEGMSEGFRDGSLDFRSKGINDSMMPELCEWIVKLGDKVKALNLGGNQITSVGSSMLFDTLKTTNSSIKEIYLHYNQQIEDKCMKSLGEYIKSNKNMAKIVLDNTSISDAGTEILAPYLDGNTTFKELYLTYNKGITDKSIPSLMKMIESSCVEHISIANTSISQKNTIYVLSGCNIVKNGSTSLDLSQREINDDDLIKICDTMKKYGVDKLKEINLSQNKLTTKGASALFDTLKEYNSIISKLNLSLNQLDDECMKQLGEYLQCNEFVEILRLANNKITDKGIEILSENLIGNTTLKELHLYGNEGITDASAPDFIEMINKSFITNLDVRFSPISGEKQREINDAFSIPIDQREIPIKSNTKSAAKISAST